MSRNLLAFVDLEKAFDCVPRQVLWLALRYLGVPEWPAGTIQAMYTIARSRVRINNSYSDSFSILVVFFIKALF